MRRRHPVTARETLRLQPKSRRSDPVPNTAKDITLDLEDVVLLAAVITAFVVLIILFTRPRRKQKRTLPNIPWVHLAPKGWLSKLRARTWTTVNYEAALQEAYDTVCTFRRSRRSY